MPILGRSRPNRKFRIPQDVNTVLVSAPVGDIAGLTDGVSVQKIGSINLDASTPARVTATGATTATTASFTPPSGSVLVATAQGASGVQTNATIAITNSGTALGWTLVGTANPTTTGGGNGVATMHYATVTTGAAMTVTATQTNGSSPTSLKVYVLAGANTSGALGAVEPVAGNHSTANSTTTQAITTTQNNSWVFCSASEWVAPGTAPTSSNLTYDAWAATTNEDGLSGYIIVPTAGTAQTCNLKCAGTTTANWQYVTAEFLPVGAANYVEPEADNENLTDRVSTAFSGFQAPADSENLTDSVTVSVSHLAQTAADSEGLTDAVRLSRSITIADTAALHDSANAGYLRNTSAADNASLHDAIVLLQGKGGSDREGLRDAVTLAVSLFKAPADTSRLTDSVTISRSITIAGTLALHDSANAGYLKPFSKADTASLHDAFTALISITTFTSTLALLTPVGPATATLANNGSSIAALSPTGPGSATLTS